MVVYIYFGHDRVKGFNVPLRSSEALPNFFSCAVSNSNDKLQRVLFSMYDLCSVVDVIFWTLIRVVARIEIPGHLNTVK